MPHRGASTIDYSEEAPVLLEPPTASFFTVFEKLTLKDFEHELEEDDSHHAPVIIPDNGVIDVPDVSKVDWGIGDLGSFECPSHRLTSLDYQAQKAFMYNLRKEDFDFHRRLSPVDQSALPLPALQAIMDRLEWWFPRETGPSISEGSILPSPADFETLYELWREPQAFQSEVLNSRTANPCDIVTVREHTPPNIAPVMAKISLPQFTIVLRHWLRLRDSTSDRVDEKHFRQPGAPLVMSYRKPPDNINDYKPFCPSYSFSRLRKQRIEAITNGLPLAHHLATQTVIREQLVSVRDAKIDKEFNQRWGLASIRVPGAGGDTGHAWVDSSQDTNSDFVDIRRAEAVEPAMPPLPTAVPAHLRTCVKAGVSRPPVDVDLLDGFLMFNRFGSRLFVHAPTG